MSATPLLAHHGGDAAMIGAAPPLRARGSSMIDLPPGIIATSWRRRDLASPSARCRSDGTLMGLGSGVSAVG
jgi:hypothetical protein